MCGGGIPIVSDVVDAVSDVFDKADNWTEGAGDMLADIDPGPALGDAGEFIDKSVIQPMKEDPLAAVATIAATATQQYWALPIIAGTATAARGGSLEDIALSAGVAFVAAQAAPYVAKAMPAATSIAGKIATGAATGAVIGAGAGATTATVKGKSVGDYALRGGVAGGVASGVASGVSQGYRAIQTEFGIGNTYTPDIQTDASMIAAQAESARSAGAGEAQIQDILTREGVQPFTAADVAGMTANGIGEQAVAQNIVGSYSPTETYRPPPISPDNIFEKTGKKLVTDLTKKAIMNEIFEPQQAYLRSRPTRSRTDTGEDTTTSGTSALEYLDNAASVAQVTPSKYELRKFVNSEGNTTLVSFKDDKPQTPIPSGYKEVEVVGAAKGGLIKKPSKKAKGVVQSKNALAAAKEDKLPTTRKGLAVK